MGRGSDEVLRDLLGLREKVYRLFDATPQRSSVGSDVGTSRWEPPVDIHETDDGYVLLAEVPGMSQDEIHLEVSDDLLVLHGERPPTTTETARSYHRLERPEGAFRRVFRLPAEVDPERICAIYREGVLRVTLPRCEPASGRTIAVQLED